MALPDRIEGLAIVSDDGMIADASGKQPEALKLEADQRYFRRTLDQAAALVHGKNSGEGGPDASRRRRLILTRQIAGLAPAPGVPRAMLWNPAGATLTEAWDALGLSGGLLVVIGGSGPFGEFLPRYDAFHLSRSTMRSSTFSMAASLRIVPVACGRPSRNRFCLRKSSGSRLSARAIMSVWLS